ncbi:DNA ligase [Paenibacillus terrae]|uniref:DNA ligase n=1 Tax=Paenibacillus terrae TaxID=159743 RepID=A0A4U2PU60_9BACL|nr:DNA ligase [Paenibacillus terrae]TKH43113.1 DNA ligase [Paenibacillus terrae]
MNIGSVFRGLLGDVKAGEAKKLDMQPGQVVRGVVLKVSEDGGEAVLQIQGSQVRAKLETPLQPGQSTLLQVQPASPSGMTVLKPLNDAANTGQQTVALADVLDSVGLPDTAQNRELIQAMQKNGVPLTSENAASLRDALAKQPGKLQMETFVQAAAVAFQRGLPLTAESINGLRQAMFGPPLNDLLSSLEQQLEAVFKQQGQGASADRMAGEATAAKWADRTSSAPSGVSSAVVADAPEGQVPVLSKDAAAVATKQSEAAQAAGGKETLKGTQAANLAAMVGEAGASATDMDAPTGTAASVAKGAASGESAVANGRGAIATDLVADSGVNAPESAADVLRASRAGAEQPQAATAGTQQPKGTDGAPAATTAEPAGAKPAATATAADRTAAPQAAAGNSATPEAPLQRLRTLLQELRAAVPPALGTAAPEQPAAEAPQLAAGAQRATDTAATQPAAAVPSSTQLTPTEDPWVGRVLKLLGAEHEQQVHRAAAQTAQGTAAARMEPPEGAQPLPGLVAAAGGAVSADADTVKGALLQLMSSDDLPPALKEAAQQVVQHLTGQQLLLNTDRTAPFAQVHMFIPFVGPDGRETATIQIQSRRGKRGELDASNCRLWFDLEMKALGPTLVDVQVVDRIVSLKLHNDQDWVASLLTSGRESIHTALESIGYQLLTLRTEPMPVRTEQESKGMVFSEVQSYVPQPYKGVDLKI